MKERRIYYLDTSAIIKRYIEEKGSDIVDDIFLRTYSREILISFSIWNIGEVLGVLDRAKNTKRIKEDDYKIVRKRFLNELKRLSRLNVLVLIPISKSILKDSWILVERHHIYVADALQIASAKRINSSKFFTGDEQLHYAAQKEGLDSTLFH